MWQNVFTYSATISACEKGGQWERALSLFRQMREEGVQPNGISYCATLAACDKGGQWEIALALLKEMREEGVQPDVIG